MRNQFLSIAVFVVLFTACNKDDDATSKIKSISYTEFNSVVKSQIRGVSVVDNNTVWMSGSKGAIFRTTNGGTTWSEDSLLGYRTNQFRDIEAFDANIAYAMAITSPAALLKTTNGGTTWVAQHSDGVNFFDAMSFWNVNSGIAIADPVNGKFTLFSTNDGGTTWTQLPNAPANDSDEWLYAASGTCIFTYGTSDVWFVTGWGNCRMFHSSDKGNTWETVVLPLLKGEKWGAFSIAFYNSNKGVTVGGNYGMLQDSTKNAAITDDGGKTWQLLTKNKPSGFREVVVYVPGTDGNCLVTLGPGGADFSNDGGLTWTKFTVPDGLHCLAFAPNGKTAFAGGDNGKIVKLEINF